jgi:hypothetical protein
MNHPRITVRAGRFPAYFLGRPRAVYVDRYRPRRSR